MRKLACFFLLLSLCLVSTIQTGCSGSSRTVVTDVAAGDGRSDSESGLDVIEPDGETKDSHDSKDPDSTVSCKSDPDCDDSNPCTDDSCGDNSQCVHTNNAAECDAGPCTDEDKCSDGVCKPGTDVDCDDSNVCTDDQCDTNSGQCVHTDNTEPCDDGNKCTPTDQCVDGECTGSGEVDCSDDDPCTDASCVPAQGCVYPFNTADCDDGNGCTENDKCNEGICAGTQTAGCECTDIFECAEFEDGDFCNGTLTCNDNKCEVDPGSFVYCLDDTPDDCMTFVCEPATGGCIVATSDDGHPCEEGNKCTVGDTCLEGECQPGPDAVCNDFQICTTDSCDYNLGCVFTPNSELCNDGNLCTESDTCSEGVCLGLQVNCDDTNPCTDDSCDPAEGCKHEANSIACNDKNICTEYDVCLGTVCAGTPTNCSDNNPCTDDVCDLELGCLSTNNSESCTDNNPCTDNDICIDGTCQGGSAHVCDDSNVCTTDTCIAGFGCNFANNMNSCVNDNKCTENDVCSSGDCIDGPSVDCDDSNPCTLDLCLPSSGCSNTPKPNGSVCNDGVACTVGDKCTDGVCGGTGPNCNDNNPCTDDLCDNILEGCYHVNDNTNKCSDLNQCTIGDKCNAGVCVGLPKLCFDGNPCTTDTCNSLTGCKFTNNTLDCDDGNECTSGEECKDGQCKGGMFKFCIDLNPCTADSCDPETGCVYTPVTGSCTDKNACTGDDKCVSGVCTGSPINCNDYNVCTDDSCVPATGCKYVSNTAPCSDNNICNGADTCSGGTCVVGTKDLCTGCGTASPNAGCNGCACEECVCAIDPYCCTTAWDAVCVVACKDASICPQTCQYNGCNSLPIAGCNGCPCQNKVCLDDPYCCNVRWDMNCAQACKDLGSACGTPGGAGCQVGYGTDNKGCDGCACETMVCLVDPYCCQTFWDATCVSECKNYASAHCADSGGRGCTTHQTPGCNNCPCQADVCAADPYCCNVKWDSACINQCKIQGYICD